MSRFKDYATSTAFSISLSRSMCEAMEYIVRRRAQDAGRGLRPCGAFPLLTSVHSLERRGLAEATPRGWKLTDAGEALYPLLVMAGLVRDSREFMTAEARVSETGDAA